MSNYLFKNTADQQVRVICWNAAGELVNGDAANQSMRIKIDSAAYADLADATPVPDDDLDGVYVYDLTQAETNGNVLIFSPSSTTAGLRIYALPSAVQGTKLPDTAPVVAGCLEDLFIGDDYTADNGRPIEFDINAVTGGTVGVATASLFFKADAENELTVEGGVAAITDMLDGTWRVSFDVSIPESLRESEYEYFVRITNDSGKIKTPKFGTVDLVKLG